MIYLHEVFSHHNDEGFSHFTLPNPGANLQLLDESNLYAIPFVLWEKMGDNHALPQQKNTWTHYMLRNKNHV